MIESLQYSDYYVLNAKSKNDLGFIQFQKYAILRQEHDRFQREKTFPITSFVYGTKVSVNDDGFIHSVDGPAIYEMDDCGELFYRDYYIDGLYLPEDEWLKKTRRRLYFLREKIVTLKKLLEIPELYQEVYYRHKNRFFQLMTKVGIS